MGFSLSETQQAGSRVISKGLEEAKIIRQAQTGLDPSWVALNILINPEDYPAQTLASLLLNQVAQIGRIARSQFPLLKS